MKVLKFGKGNAKLSKKTATFSLPAGFSCPFAHNCLSKANRQTGKLTDGKHTEFRCFSASSEAIYKNTRNARWYNFDLLKGLKTAEMADLIYNSLPKNVKLVRIHVSGDFFNASYFHAWLIVAKLNPETTFYAYTKSLQYWVDRINDIPNNMKLTASYGGKNDHLIEENGLKSVKVVYSYEEAERLGLEIDHDDSHCYASNKNFALLIHGGQPAGSKASKAKEAIKKKGWTGYSKKTAA